MLCGCGYCSFITVYEDAFLVDTTYPLHCIAFQFSSHVNLVACVGVGWAIMAWVFPLG